MARTQNTNDHTGGRVFFTTAAAGGALSAAGNGSVQSPNFNGTQGHTQVTFGVNRPAGAGTWMPNAVDDQGNLITLLATARTIAANHNDSITLQCNFDQYCITFTDTSGSTNAIQSMYFGEAPTAG